MSKYRVALTPEGDFAKVIEADSPEIAAQRWASWYCHYSTEWKLDECWLEQFPSVWRSYSITIESVPVFHAVGTAE